MLQVRTSQIIYHLLSLNRFSIQSYFAIYKTDKRGEVSLQKYSVKCFSSFCWYMENNFFFFLSGFSFIDTDDSEDSRWREGTIFYSTLTLPPTDEHSDIDLQLCMWGDYHIFSVAVNKLVNTTTLVNTSKVPVKCLCESSSFHKFACK